MPIVTTDNFFAVLEKSRLLSQDELTAARDLVAAANGEAADATAAARVLARENMLTRWQAGQLLAGRSTFYLGKYKLIDLLGRGGMGSVFLGEHVMMNRRVAIKVLAKQIGKEPGSLERFLAEARAIAALDHPNIVHAYNVDQEGERYYIVMEYVDGTDLQRIVEKEGPLDFARAADYVRQAAEGLAHAHTQKIVHCDIKPSNLVVNSQNALKILDMGLARLLGRDQPAAEQADESILGSVDYQAPEQALESADFDHRADIYALGCTLYYLLTGQPPFPDGTLPERILKHQHEQPKPLVELRKETPAGLIAVCEKMMAKDPADRYQSGAEVSEAIAALRLAARKPKRAAPLKKAEALEEEPAAGPVVVTNGARKKTAPATKAATAAAEAEKPTKAGKARHAGMAASLWATSQGKAILIGSGAIAVLFLVVISVVIGMMLGGGGGKKDDAKHAAAPTPIDDETANERRRALDADAIDAELDRAVKIVAQAPPVKPEQPAPPKTVGNEPKTNPDVPAATPPKTEPPKTEPPKTEPPKTEPPKTEPPKTDKPKEPIKPKDPPKPKPFEHVAKAVEMPKVPKEANGAGPVGDPVALGAVKLGGKPLDIQLVGGEVAKTHQFKLAAVEPGKAWTIAEEMKGERVEIAQVKLDGEKPRRTMVGRRRNDRPTGEPNWQLRAETDRRRRLAVRGAQSARAGAACAGRFQSR